MNHNIENPAWMRPPEPPTIIGCLSCGWKGEEHTLSNEFDGEHTIPTCPRCGRSDELTNCDNLDESPKNISAERITEGALEDFFSTLGEKLRGYDILKLDKTKEQQLKVIAMAVVKDIMGYPTRPI